MADLGFLATCSGVPCAMILPPLLPPSGPMSMMWSAHLMTLRLCSMIIMELPPLTSLSRIFMRRLTS